MEQSSFLKEIAKIIPILASNNASVLLCGEKGTGKRFFALKIFEGYSLKTEETADFNNFFEINFKNSWDEDRLQNQFSEILENLKNKDKNLKIVLFLNCVEKCSLKLQKALLSFLKDHSENNFNLKIISSAEENLEENCSKNKFLSELLIFLNSVVINVLPLRQRKDDIVYYAELFRRSYSKSTGIIFDEYTQDALESLQNYFFAGNIDELKNMIQHGFITGFPPLLKTTDLFTENSVETKTTAADIAEIEGNKGGDRTLKSALDAFKKEYVTKILEENGWNQTKTAKILGIQRTYVIRLINELHIRRK